MTSARSIAPARGPPLAAVAQELLGGVDGRPAEQQRADADRDEHAGLGDTADEAAPARMRRKRGALHRDPLERRPFMRDAGGRRYRGRGRRPRLGRRFRGGGLLGSEQLLELPLGAIQDRLARGDVGGGVTGLAVHPGAHPLDVAALGEVQRQEKHDCDQRCQRDEAGCAVEDLRDLHRRSELGVVLADHERQGGAAGELANLVDHRCHRRLPELVGDRAGEVLGLRLGVRLEHDRRPSKPDAAVSSVPTLKPLAGLTTSSATFAASPATASIGTEPSSTCVALSTATSTRFGFSPPLPATGSAAAIVAEETEAAGQNAGRDQAAASTAIR